MSLPVAGQLPASKTHNARRWTFLGTNDERPGVGVLTIVQGKRDVASYAIDVVDGQVLFAKLNDGEPEVYGVDLTRHGQPCRCNCKGFAFSRSCKHLTAAKELIADGVIEAAPTTTTKSDPNADLEAF